MGQDLKRERREQSIRFRKENALKKDVGDEILLVLELGAEVEGGGCLVVLVHSEVRPIEQHDRSVPGGVTDPAALSNLDQPGEHITPILDRPAKRPHGVGVSQHPDELVRLERTYLSLFKLLFHADSSWAHRMLTCGRLSEP